VARHDWYYALRPLLASGEDYAVLEDESDVWIRRVSLERELWAPGNKGAMTLYALQRDSAPTADEVAWAYEI
jgi:hypothetical protein